jgi:cytochrome P450
VKATQVTGLAAGREYLRCFFDPVGTICRLYQRYGPVTALGRVQFKQPRDLLLFAIGPEFNRLFHQLMDEIESVLADAPPRPDQLPQLPFLHWVIKASMRILPPVPYTVRVAQQPLKAGPFEVPRETRVIASHYLTHHLPDLYPDPERFRLERWRNINPTQYEYLPFNTGPRICIGGAFATQVLKISLAMILQRFRFTVVPGTRINRAVAISMNPRHGLPMIIAKKDRNYSVSEVRGQIREMVDLPANGAR